MLHHRNRYPDDEIEEKVDELRKQLLADYEKAKASGGRTVAGAHGGGSHSVAEAKAEKMKAFGGALGIQESYVAGTYMCWLSYCAITLVICSRCRLLSITQLTLTPMLSW